MKFRWRLALALCLILACLGSVARAEGDFSVTAEEMMLGVIRSAACTESAVYALAKALGVTEAWLVGYDVPMEESSNVLPADAEPYKPTGYMPVLGRVAAGLPIYAEENIEEYIACDFPNSEDYFALKVKGDSMNAAGINEGDYVIVRKQDIVDNGDIAVVLVNGDEATVKRFSRTDNTVVLTPQSMNPAHQVQIYDTKDVPVRVLGKVVESRHKY